MSRNDNRFTPEDGERLTRAKHDREQGTASSIADLDTDDYGIDDLKDELEEESPEIDDEPQFHRAKKRVPVRKTVTKKTATRLRWVFAAVFVFGLLGGGTLALVNYGTKSWRFRIESSDQIETATLQNVTRSQVMEVMGADIGRNIFRVPLEERKKQLEEIPWVQTATVMRLLPDHIRIQLTERKPVAFVRMGSKIQLIDATGTIMDLPTHTQNSYSFPVITGMVDSEPLSTRAARMKIYDSLMKDLDSGGGNYSKDISEVELSDPDDVKITVEDPAGALVVHLGATAFLERYRIYINHIQEWRQQFQKLESVDLRYNNQIIVNPDARPVQQSNAAPEQQETQPEEQAETPKPKLEKAKAVKGQSVNGKRNAKSVNRH